MASKREQVLAAVFAALQNAYEVVTVDGEPVYVGRPGMKVRRNEPLPQAVPSGGLIIMRDGAPGVPDVSLHPRSEYYQHEIEIEAFSPDNDSEELDDMLRAIDGALSADDTFGGLVEYLAVSNVEVDGFAGDGTVPMLAARVSVIVEYQTSGALA